MAGIASQSTPEGRPDLREAGLDRGPPVAFTFDSAPIVAFAGESVAAALLAAGITSLRRSPRSDGRRGAFCWMGTCQDCTVVVDGHRRPACRTPVAEAMAVRSGTIG